MALTVDASTPLPAVGSPAGSHTLISNAFSPPAGSLVWVQIYNNSASGFMTGGLTDSLGALTWRPVASFLDVAAGVAHEVWYAYVPTAPGSMTVTGSYVSLAQWTATVIVWDGALPVQAGNATATWSSATSGVLAMSPLLTTAPGSQVVMTGDENSGTTPTPLAGQTLTINGTGTFETSFDQWTQILTAPAGAKGTSVAMGVSAPTATGSSAFAVEVLAGPTVDPSTAAQATGSSHVATSAAFSPVAGSVVLVPIFNSTSQLASGVTDSAAALTWRRIPNAIWQDSINGTTTEFWYAAVSTAPGSITVSTGTYTVVCNWVIDAIVLTGVQASQVGGAVASGYMTTADLSQSITTNGPGSLLLSAVLFPNATAPTPASGQTLTINGVSTFSGWINSWLQMKTTPVPAAGTSFTMATTSGGAAYFSALTIEILAAPVTTTASPSGAGILPFLLGWGSAGIVPMVAGPPPTAPALKIVTVSGSYQLQDSNGDQFVTLGTTEWSMPDNVTGTTTGSFALNEWADIGTVINAEQANGINVVRLRLLAGYYNSLGSTAKTAYINQIVARLGDAKAQGVILQLCLWDPLDSGPSGFDYSGSNLPGGYTNMFGLIDAVCSAVGNDPDVVWEPMNEPNSITSTQLQTVAEGLIQRLRVTNDYLGVIVIDPWNWANSGSSGAGYSDTVYTAIESYDAGLLGSHHQIAFAVHQYWAPDYQGLSQGSTGGWSLSNFQSVVLGGTTTHCIICTEIGFDNPAPGNSSTAWATAAVDSLAGLPASMKNYGGTIGFIQDWVDDNTLFGLSDRTTATAWGAIFFGLGGGSGGGGTISEDFGRWFWWGQGQGGPGGNTLTGPVNAPSTAWSDNFTTPVPAGMVSVPSNQNIWGTIETASAATFGIPNPPAIVTGNVALFQVTAAQVANDTNTGELDVMAKLFSAFGTVSGSVINKPADVSGTYAAWYYFPTDYLMPQDTRGTDWVNLFQFKQTQAGAGGQTDPQQWLEVSPAGWLRDNPLPAQHWVGTEPPSSVNLGTPCFIINYWGNPWTRDSAVMLVPLGRWFQVTCTVIQNVSYAWTVDGTAFDTVPVSACPVGPDSTHPGEWIFGIGNYATCVGIIYAAGATYTPPGVPTPITPPVVS